MTLLDSLLDAIVRLEGDALVMHVGEKPYVVTTSSSMGEFRGPLAWGQVELSSRVLTPDAVVAMLDQVLPIDARHALDEFGAIEHEIASARSATARFTVVAARGGDDLWLEIRRRPVMIEPDVATAGIAIAVEGEDAATVVIHSQPAVEHAPADATVELSDSSRAQEPDLVTPAADAPAFAESMDDDMEALLAAGAAALLHPVASIDEDEADAIAPAPVSKVAESMASEAPLASEAVPLPDPALAGANVELLCALDADSLEALGSLAAALDMEQAGDSRASEEHGTIGAAPESAIAAADAPSPADETTAPVPILAIEPTVVGVLEASAEDTGAEWFTAPTEDDLVRLFNLQDASAEMAVADDAAVPPMIEIFTAPRGVEVEPSEIAIEPDATVERPVIGAVVKLDALDNLEATEVPGALEATEVPDDIDPASFEESGVVEFEPWLADAEVFQAPASVERQLNAPLGLVPPMSFTDDPDTSPLDRPSLDAAAEFEPRPVVVPLSRRPRADQPSNVVTHLEDVLRQAAARGASTVYAVAGSHAMMRAEGDMGALDADTITTTDVDRFILELAPAVARDLWQHGAPAEWMSDLPDVGRVRCMTFRDHRGPGLVFRMMPPRAISADQLGLTHAVQALSGQSEGFVLVTGPRAGGKSTLMSAFVDLINRTRSDHVITIESQIGFVHENRRAFISQREYRGDVDAAVTAVKGALREDPDVLLIEDLRSAELVSAALESAESGRLVFGSLPAPSTVAAIDRLLELFSPERRPQIQSMLATTLRGVVAQVLVRRARGGRVAAREVLLNTPSIAALIQEAKIAQLPLAIESGRRVGMMPLNDALVALVREGTVNVAEAYRKAFDKDALLAALKRHGIDTSSAERLA